MTSVISVREYARLTTEHVAKPSLDHAQIPTSAFDWLCNLSSTFSRSGAALVQIEGRRWLRLDNYVGVIETPCGTKLEILPKHVNDGDILEGSRKLLQRMIAASLNLPARIAGEASLRLFDVPLSEWIMERFLIALDQLIKRGIRSDYVRIEAQERYLRGRLDLVRQVRQPVGRQHILQIEHDILVPDRPENRLLKTALETIAKHVQLPNNWRLAQNLRILLQEIPSSVDISADFKRWTKDRLMAHYQPILPWCELILYRQMPLSLAGQWRGISMLFPMERLFERYVAASLKKVLAPGVKLVTQAASQSLCFHDGGTMFQLRPDLLIEHGPQRWLLDTKWKRINQNERSSNYRINQSDFYQMFAYGKKYLQGAGELALIYPRHAHFSSPLPVFNFDNHLRLWALPFDLDSGSLLLENGSTLPLCYL
ncbi:hypothetical protein PT7_2209 [Pusillimonas sp. T7-7]|nr:hypothetical protein PT7_2209 [Pusillimonas sp. T7-7]